jgi:small conductance mechanosensitive channel
MNRFFQSIVERLTTLFDPALLGVATAELVANLLVALLTFFAYYVLWRVLDLVARLFTRRIKLDETTRDFTLTILKFAVLTIAVVNSLAALGVDTAAVIASLGVAGLTIGFAARDALSNLISGILIYWDRPFVIGDLVEVGDLYGRVDRITLRSTRVVTPDGRMLAVPNTQIINGTVASYTNVPHLRIDTVFTVGVNEDLGRVREMLLDLVRASPEYMRDPPPEVIVTALNDYNIEMELRAWALDEQQHLKLRAALIESVLEALRRAGVEMPFETLSIEPMTVLQASAG